MTSPLEEGDLPTAPLMEIVVLEGDRSPAPEHAPSCAVSKDRLAVVSAAIRSRRPEAQRIGQSRRQGRREYAASRWSHFVQSHHHGR